MAYPTTDPISVATVKRHIAQKAHRTRTNKGASMDLCRKGTLMQFWNEVNAREDAVNCLDLPKSTGWAPFVVEYAILPR